MIRVLFVGSGTTFREKVQLPKAEAVLASYNTQHRHLNLGCSATVHNKNNALVARAVRVTRQQEARIAVQHFVSQPEMVRATANALVCWIETDRGKTVDGYDDDRQTGMGSHILCFLRSEGIRNVVVVLTRGGDSYTGTDFLRRWNVSKMCIFNMSGPHLN